jgi:hypothetical protein
MAVPANAMAAVRVLVLLARPIKQYLRVVARRGIRGCARRIPH